MEKGIYLIKYYQRNIKQWKLDLIEVDENSNIFRFGSDEVHDLDKDNEEVLAGPYTLNQLYKELTKSKNYATLEIECECGKFSISGKTLEDCRNEIMQYRKENFCEHDILFEKELDMYLDRIHYAGCCAFGN